MALDKTGPRGSNTPPVWPGRFPARNGEQPRSSRVRLARRAACALLERGLEGPPQHSGWVRLDAGLGLEVLQDLQEPVHDGGVLGGRPPRIRRRQLVEQPGLSFRQDHIAVNRS